MHLKFSLRCLRLITAAFKSSSCGRWLVPTWKMTFYTIKPFKAATKNLSQNLNFPSLKILVPIFFLDSTFSLDEGSLPDCRFFPHLGKILDAFLYLYYGVFLLFDQFSCFIIYLISHFIDLHSNAMNFSLRLYLL